jgi:hypothetical protein
MVRDLGAPVTRPATPGPGGDSDGIATSEQPGQGAAAAGQGRTVESILDILHEAEHWHHQVSKVVLDSEDERWVELVAIRVERSRRFWPGP